MKRESPRKSREPSQRSSFALPSTSGSSANYATTAPNAGARPGPQLPAGSPSAARAASVSVGTTSSASGVHAQAPLSAGSNVVLAGNARAGEVTALPMLSSPLMLQATALRRPEMYEQHVRPECVEEGDILYDVLRNPLVHTPYTSRTTTTTTTTNAAGETSTGPAKLPPAVHTQPFGVRPVLCLPTKIGMYVAHEVFRALLCFYNSAPYALHGLDIRIEYSQGKEARQPLFEARPALLAPQALYATVVEMPLRASGMCTLHVRALYKDPAEEGRRLLWATSVQVEDGLTELTRQLRRIYCSRKLAQPALTPSPPQRATSALHSAAKEQERQDNDDDDDDEAPSAAAVLLPETRYVLSIELCNTARAPLMLTGTELVLAGNSNNTTTSSSTSAEPGHGSPTQASRVSTVSSSSFAANSLFSLVRTAHMRAAGSTEDKKRANNNSSNKTGCSDDAPSHTLLEPGDVMMLMYELRMDSDVLRAAMRQTKVQAHSAGGVSAMILPGALYALGHVRWSWCRANGEVGQGRSAPLQLARLRASSEMDLVVLDVRQTGADGQSYSFVNPSPQPSHTPIAHDTKTDHAARVSSAAALLPLTALRVGQPVELDCVVLYYPQGNPSTTSTSTSNTGVSTGRAGSVAHAPDVALKVRVEQLAPDWLYAGPAVRPLGLLEQGMVSFTITLIPWRAGWRALAAGLEIVDARALDTVLWPPARVVWLEPWSAVLQGNTSAAANSTRTGTVVGQTAAGTAYYPTASYATPVSAQTTTSTTATTGGTQGHAGHEVLMPLLKDVGPEGETEPNARPVLLQALVL